MSVKLCFIKPVFYEDHPKLTKILDVDDPGKRSKRTHLCLIVNKNDNTFYIPLRNNLGEPVRKFGRIGHAVPSEKRAKAGLDYRYTLVINDEKYIEIATERKIAKRQMKIIEDDYQKICNEFSVYLNGYISAAKHGRADRIPLYRESSLVNFYEELGIPTIN